MIHSSFPLKSASQKWAEKSAFSLSKKNASLMIMLTIPSLVFYGFLTIPTLLFPSPHQHAYFHFAREINQDPGRWLPYSLAAACVLIAMVLPALDSRWLKLPGLSQR